MARIHIYTVHVQPQSAQPYEEAKFIEEGFSWLAFFFGVVWLFYHRLWLAAIGLLCLNGVLFSMVHNSMLSHSGYSIVNLGVHLLVGCWANDWRRAKLTRQGYIIVDIVASDSLMRAEQRFFDRYFLARTVSPFAS